jgi:hypothetical protein
MDMILRTVPILGAVVALVVLGLVETIWELMTAVERLDFTVEYQRRFTAFAQAWAAGAVPVAEYQWLAEKQPAMSIELGAAGYIFYQAPFRSFAVDNYPLLANVVAGLATGTAHSQELRAVSHMLVTHGGVLRDQVHRLQSTVKNPLALFQRGFQFVIGLPVLLLSWAGLLPAAAAQRTLASWPFRLVRFVLAVAGALGAVEGLIAGWPALLHQADQVLAWLRAL